MVYKWLVLQGSDIKQMIVCVVQFKSNKCCFFVLFFHKFDFYCCCFLWCLKLLKQKNNQKTKKRLKIFSLVFLISIYFWSTTGWSLLTLGKGQPIPLFLALIPDIPPPMCWLWFKIAEPSNETSWLILRIYFPYTLIKFSGFIDHCSKLGGVFGQYIVLCL